jgi:hypothetical protein
MNKRFFIPAAAAGILALAMSGSAMAAGIGGVHRQELVMEAGTDPNSIQIHFAGADRVTIAAGGQLEIVNTDGGIWRYRPSVYQVVNGKRHQIVAGFRVMDKDRVALRVSKFDASVPLVFGPVDRP